MAGFYMPTKSADSWREALADPEKHWKKGYSAYELAHSWEGDLDFPDQVRQALNTSGVPALTDLTRLLGFPEHKVALPPAGGRPSQTDLFVLARSGVTDDLVSIAVEGKASESFGPLVSAWFEKPSEGKKKRLAFLLTQLGLQQHQVKGIRYQLLHRTVSALLEAKRFGARVALMLVHSFSGTHEGYADYAAFAQLLGAKPTRSTVVHAPVKQGIPLYLGWVTG